MLKKSQTIFKNFHAKKKVLASSENLEEVFVFEIVPELL